MGRGGLFAELCATVPVHELARIHRFTHTWEAAASRQLRAGDPAALDDYQAHGRIHAGTLDHHVAAIAAAWPALAAAGTVAVTAATNDHVDLLNHAIQAGRLAAGHLDPARAAAVGGGEWAHAGDWVATRRNDRTLVTAAGHAVHNRDQWTIDRVHGDGALTVNHRHGHGTVTLPAEYAARHVRLGYAATGHGHQGDTVDVALSLVDGSTTHRGLYVAATRGRHDNTLHVITDTADPAEARDILESVLGRDRADIPAVAQRRHLVHQAPAPPVTPRAPTPPWLPDAVAALRDRRDELRDRHDSYQHGRREAAAELVGLQPALAAARADWRPYAERIDTIHRDLEHNLKPAMWSANHEVMHARFGHRHATQRRAAHATEAVADARTQIAAIEREGSAIEKRLDALTARAENLSERVTGRDPLALLDGYDRQNLQHAERLLEALTTWERWANGRPVPAADLAACIETLVEATHDAPHTSHHDSRLTRANYTELFIGVDNQRRQLGLENRNYSASLRLRA